MWLQYLLKKKFLKNPCPRNEVLTQKKRIDSFGRELGIVLNQLRDLYLKLRNAGIDHEFQQYADNEVEPEGLDNDLDDYEEEEYREKE